MKNHYLLLYTTIVLLIVNFNGFSQVGINTDNPSQALDVNGKVKIGNDAMAPTEGAIRYNSTLKIFKGYDGTSWIQFNGDIIERSFKIKRNTSFTIPSNTATSVPIDVVEINNGDCLVEFSSQYFRAPVSGRYQLNLSVNICSAASIGGVNADLNKIDSGGGSPQNISRYVFTRTGSSSDETFSISTVVDLQQGDRIIVLFGNAGSSTNEITFCGGSGINAIEISGFLIK